MAFDYLLLLDEIKREKWEEVTGPTIYCNAFSYILFSVRMKKNVTYIIRVQHTCDELFTSSGSHILSIMPPFFFLKSTEHVDEEACKNE